METSICNNKGDTISMFIIVFDGKRRHASYSQYLVLHSIAPKEKTQEFDTTNVGMICQTMDYSPLFPTGI